MNNDTPDQTPIENITAEPETNNPIQQIVSDKKILCIEDEHFISELYSRALKKAGYDVTVVIDGADGLQAARTNQYDIILLDIMLPNVTGVEILQALRGPEAVTQLKAKIIVTTNLEQSEERRAEVEALADGYVIKAEVTPHQLVDFLSHLNA